MVQNDVPEKTQIRYLSKENGKLLAEEIKMALKADYSYPIIIDEQGGLVDGAHRIVHAYLDGVETIKAVTIREEQFPEPDYDEHKAVNS